MNTIKISASFRKKTTKAIFSIALFVIVYLLLIALAIALTIACAYAGMMIIALKVMLITLGLGIGILSMGLFVLFFLFKFITVKHVVDRSHLIEITQAQQPVLFDFIYSIAREIHTTIPKKVYLSADVNAAVFYDSSFLSMFLPVKKNLQIGMGLVNAVSEAELKAILAHEFGHFSQRSMKVGSYVYLVNNVIYNLLYENDSFDLIMVKWANSGWFLQIFVQLAAVIIKWIKQVLKKMYAVVNLSYMELSREMEFHADAVAATFAGSGPMRTALLRSDLAEQSYGAVLNYYETQIENCIRSVNIYPEQSIVMSFIASENAMPQVNDLPLVTEEYQSRQNKSSLNLDDPWASHPSTLDRLLALKQWDTVAEKDDPIPANRLFQDIEQVQATITDTLFARVDFKESAILNSKEVFVEEFEKAQQLTSFDKRYAGYYDNKNPVLFTIDTQDSQPDNYTLDDLLNAANTDKVYTAIALQKDIQVLQEIAAGETPIKYFNYNGSRFPACESGAVIEKMQQSLEKLQQEIEINDEHLMVYFLGLAQTQQAEPAYREKINAFYACDTLYDQKIEYAKRLSSAIDFIKVTTPFNEIESNLVQVYALEKDFKTEIRGLLADPLFQDAFNKLKKEIREDLKKYLSRQYIYFTKPDYDNDALQVLYAAIHHYYNVLYRAFFLKKKDLLQFQMQLVDRG